jgi:hypothetical protein
MSVGSSCLFLVVGVDCKISGVAFGGCCWLSVVGLGQAGSLASELRHTQHKVSAWETVV